MEDDLTVPQPGRLFGLLDFLADQLAKVRFELLLELVRRLERMERRLERAVVVEELAPDEALQRLELLPLLLPFRLVVEP